MDARRSAALRAGSSWEKAPAWTWNVWPPAGAPEGRKTTGPWRSSARSPEVTIQSVPADPSESSVRSLFNPSRNSTPERAGVSGGATRIAGTGTGASDADGSGAGTGRGVAQATTQSVVAHAATLSAIAAPRDPEQAERKDPRRARGEALSQNRDRIRVPRTSLRKSPPRSGTIRHIS